MGRSSAFRLHHIVLATTLAITLGAASASAQLIDNGDGTVTDARTGLMWLKNANYAGRAMTFDEAKTWAEGLDYAGHTDWRLPAGLNRDGTVCNSRPTGANCLETEFASLYFIYLIHVFNQGPFENIQYRTYWTGTEWPADTTHAMTQDFDDGGQNDFAKTTLHWAWPVRTAGIPPGTPALYGVVTQGTNTGALIKIDIITGAATVVGNTGLQRPCSLTYNDTAGLLYVNECFGTAGIHVVDPATAAVTRLGAAAVAPHIAYRFVDNMFHAVYDDLDFSTLMRLDVTTGASLGIVPGQLTKGPLTAITARQTDGMLFGAGFDDLLSERWLFTIATVVDASGALEREIAMLPRAYTGLAFHPNGVLYGTEGTNLYTLNPTTGASTAVGAFGSSITDVGGLAFIAPAPRRSIDVWIKDCVNDRGDVPSYPSPCATWTTSPDISVSNDAGSYPAVGVLNRVSARVRNRGSGQANKVNVRFYHGEPGTTTGWSDAKLISSTSVNVAPGSSTLAQVNWSPPITLYSRGWCVGVVLNHPNDPLTTLVPPPNHNNLAVRCGARLTAVPGKVAQVPFNFGRGDGGWGFRHWRGQFRFEARSRLPEDWKWSMEGFAVDRPIVIDPGMDPRGSVQVQIPSNAPHRSRGVLELRQVDVRTGRLLGSLELVFIHDNRPPEPPRNLRAARLKNLVTLTWDPVKVEETTGLDEHVTAYEVLRDGKAVERTATDADPARPGFQWREQVPPGLRPRYSLRAIDVSGNESRASESVQPGSIGQPPK